MRCQLIFQSGRVTMAESLVQTFCFARWRGTPLVGIVTPDPAATIQALREGLGKEEKATPLLRWDIVQGIVGLNEKGTQAATQVLGGDDLALKSGNPAEALILAAKLPKESVLFFAGAHRILGRDVPGNEAACQAAWNLRDRFKADYRTLVLLAPELVLPSELAQDVVMMEESLPDDAALADLVLRLHKSFDPPLKPPTKEVLAKAVDALRGLALFPSEQITAMSLRAKGLDLEALWARKRQAIEATKGLSVYRGTETFADIGGLDRIKEFTSGLFKGGQPPRVIVFLDEIEKMLAGARSAGLGDTSGVSQDALGVILRKMEDNEWAGLLAVGPPGAGKSLLSKALGGTFGVITLAFDLGAMKGSYVGQSEGAIRQAMRIVESVAGKGGAFFVAACNRLEALPPELRRRFRMGIWFFDLPTKAERETIWQLNLKRFGLAADTERPDDVGWTGADVRNCCDVAWRLGCSLHDAAGFLVPVSRSNPEAVDSLRVLARGKFLSASKPGLYEGPEEGLVTPEPAARKMKDGEPEGGGSKLEPGFL